MIKLSQEEIKEIIAQKYDVSVDDVILYSELSTMGNIIKCLIKEIKNENNKVSN